MALARPRPKGLAWGIIGLGHGLRCTPCVLALCAGEGEGLWGTDIWCGRRFAVSLRAFVLDWGGGGGALRASGPMHQREAGQKTGGHITGAAASKCATVLGVVGGLPSPPTPG